MSPSPSPGLVRLHRAEEDVDQVLRERVAALLGVAAHEVRVGRACPRCGADDHGRPWARAGSREVPVSLSRCGEHLMTALAPTGAVGVDLELIAAVARGWDEELVLHPRERGRRAPRTDAGRAAVWARKEAVLKMLGTGLATPMSAVRLADVDVLDVPAPPGHVAALARG
ncbi:4'-phosphopantetheinyl transferase family protein [Brachybacterium saurashtrense]|uniref:4'-phosphopantetheinyl transferase family protein n=1 Tax=Brachybacterium saurashtrense TaxID=556288 RepID=UPI000F8F545F|nr:4'-phosphopantetheinyl transferase superfamily protein [Brachybacterium saurashtrense]